MANQTQNLAAILSNFNTALEATATAYNSAGSAARQNAIHMESLEAKTNQVKAAFQDLANNVIPKELISALLKLAEKGLNFLNSGLGVLITRITLASGVLKGFGVIFGQIGVKLLAGSQIAQFFNLFIKSAHRAEDAMAAFNLTLATSPLFWIAAAAAVGYGIVKLMDYLVVTAEEAKEKVDALDQSIEELTAAGSEYDTLKEKGEDLTEIEKARLAVLEAQVVALEKQRDLAAVEWAQKFQAEQTAVSTNEAASNTGTGGANMNYMLRVASGTDAATVSVNNLEKAMQNLNHALDDGTVSEVEYQGGLGELITSNKDYYENLLLIQKLHEQFPHDVEALTPAQQRFIQLYDVLVKKMNLYSNAAGDAADANNELGDSGEDAVDGLADIEYYLKNLLSPLSATEKKFYDLKAAEIIADSQKLNFSQQIAALQELATQAGVAASIIANVFSGGVTAGQTEIAYMMKYGNMSYETALQAYLSKKYKALIGTRTVEASSGGGSSTDATLEAHKQLVSDIESEIELMETLGATTEDIAPLYEKLSKALQDQQAYMVSIGSDQSDINALATKWLTIQNKITDAAKETKEQLKEAQQELVDAYESLFSYLTDEIDKEIDALKEAYDIEDDRLELLEKEQALEEARKDRSVRVYNEATGQWEWVANQGNIESAQQALEEYQREQSLDAQIQALELQKEAIESQVNQISLNKKLDEISQQIGVDFSKGWQAIYADLDIYMAGYRDSLDKLEELNEDTLDTEQAALDVNYSAMWLQAKAAGASQDVLDAIHQAKVRQMAKLGYDESYYDPTTGTWNINKKPTTDIDDESDSSSVSEDSPTVSNLMKMGNCTREQAIAALNDYPVFSDALNAIRAGKYDNIGSNSNTSTDKTETNTAQSSYSAVGSKGQVYTVNSEAGTNFIANAEAGSTMTGGDGSTWTKNADGTTTVTTKDGATFVFSSNAKGTTSASGGLSLVGEQGPEMRVLNQGDGIIPANITKNLWGFGKDPAQYLSNLMNSNSIGTQYNFGNITLSERQAKSTTVYELAMLSRTLTVKNHV